MSILAKMAVQITADVARFAAGMDAVDKRLGRFDRMVTGLGRTMIGVFGAQAAFNGLSEAVGIMSRFEVQMSTVKAITGATGDQFKELEKNALDLGRSTRYTATQVGSLQVEFGRLGFSTKEIINATKATLNLATASGSDLARSAEIAGSTLRAFQIDAKEMGRVTDVMAAGFNTSALALDNYAESIKYVAPVAKAVNVSLEETTAMLAVLADAGIKGSQAGTSLRRIFTQLTADGRPLAERMGELAAKGITLADANDEVGLYAQTALLVLGNQNERVKELTETYKNANGETQRMADIMEDNLTGSVTKLSSAWEGLILRYKESSGYLRRLTDDTTKIINLIDNAEANLVSERRGFWAKLFPNIDQLLNLDEYTAAVEEIVRVNQELNKIKTEGFVQWPKSWEEWQAEQIKKLVDEQNKKVESYKKEREIQLQILKDTYERVQLERQINDELKARITDTSKTRSDLMSQFGIGGDGKSFDASDPMGYTFDTSNMEEYVSFYEEMGETIEEFTARIFKNMEATEMNAQSWIRFGGIVSNIMSNIISADKDLVRSVKKAAASVLQANAAQIASWLAAKFAKDSYTKTPVAAIALLTASIGVISGLLGKDWKKTSVTTGGGPSYSTSNGAMSVDLRQRGADLIGSISETERITNRTRYNG